MIEVTQANYDLLIKAYITQGKRIAKLERQHEIVKHQLRYLKLTKQSKVYEEEA